MNRVVVLPIKVGFVSLGCAKNLINTEVMISKLAEAGCEIVAEDIDADVIVINTCAFIQSAKQEAIDNILDVAWLKENRSLKGIVVTGCLAERYKEQIFEEFPEVDAVIGTGAYDDVVEAVKCAYQKKRFSCFHNVSEAPMDGDRVITTPEFFAYIKIAEGCDNCCTYCVIPSLRGRFRSRQMSDIVNEARDLAALGVKELCVIAQDTTRYGEDIYGTYCLDSLLRELSTIDGIEWIRVLYMYPDRITDALIDEIANNPKIVKYFDIPVQHVTDRMLSAMNRRDTAASIRSTAERIRAKIPDAVLRTTFITGFPGETEEDYKAMGDFIDEMKFDRLGVFEYSREEGTKAYDMPDQIPAATKHKRCKALMKRQQAVHAAKNKELVGKTVKVLSEGYDKVSECFFGRSFRDAPDVDGKIYFHSSRNVKDGTFVDVKIVDVIDYDLVGQAVFTD